MRVLSKLLHKCRLLCDTDKCFYNLLFFSLINKIYSESHLYRIYNLYIIYESIIYGSIILYSSQASYDGIIPLMYVCMYVCICG